MRSSKGGPSRASIAAGKRFSAKEKHERQQIRHRSMPWTGMATSIPTSKTTITSNRFRRPIPRKKAAGRSLDRVWHGCRANELFTAKEAHRSALESKVHDQGWGRLRLDYRAGRRLHRPGSPADSGHDPVRRADRRRSVRDGSTSRRGCDVLEHRLGTSRWPAIFRPRCLSRCVISGDYKKKKRDPDLSFSQPVLFAVRSTLIAQRSGRKSLHCIYVE